MKKIALISHGCAKNLVDSELILGILTKNGYKITLNENESDIVIINTCSFIADAERESVHSILEMIEAKKKDDAIEIQKCFLKIIFKNTYKLAQPKLITNFPSNAHNKEPTLT